MHVFFVSFFYVQLRPIEKWMGSGIDVCTKNFDESSNISLCIDGNLKEDQSNIFIYAF